MPLKIHALEIEKVEYNNKNPAMGFDEDQVSLDLEPTSWDKCTESMRKSVEGVLGMELPEFKQLKIKNSVADIEDFPKLWMWTSFMYYQLIFFGFAAVFFWYQFTDARTSTFITLDPKSGVCKTDPTINSCCEVPTIISGGFLADSRGHWNTESKFSFAKNNYGVTLAGLEYTTEQWTSVIKKIVSGIRATGLKGQTRDLAWNIIAWASYTSVNQDNGYLQFYTEGDAGIIFNKPVTATGFASDNSVNAKCNVKSTTSFNTLDRLLSVQTDLNVDNSCPNPPCAVNPCPGVLAPQAMGYDIQKATTSILSFDIDMASVTLALSVNMGIIQLENLVEVSGDNNRIRLLNSLVANGQMTEREKQNTSSFFETLYAPMDMIYCTRYDDFKAASCLVRQGDTLMFPVITSYGYSETGYDTPKQCTARNVANSKEAFYFCNQFDMNVGFIYYPVPDQNLTYELSHLHTRNPTARPTPGPGKPTLLPSHKPSAAPSVSFRPSALPTFRPSAKPTTYRPTPLPGDPTLLPTFKPTKTPSRVPTADPTPPAGSPTALPTFRPTFRPSTSKPTQPTALPTFRPSTYKPTGPSALPTFKPTAPTVVPTQRPTYKAGDPTPLPSFVPTRKPTASFRPSMKPTLKPTRLPTTFRPTPADGDPTLLPTFKPTRMPVTSKPTPLPGDPTLSPVQPPSRRPTTTRRLSNDEGGERHYLPKGNPDLTEEQKHELQARIREQSKSTNVDGTVKISQHAKKYYLRASTRVKQEEAAIQSVANIDHVNDLELDSATGTGTGSGGGGSGTGTDSNTEYYAYQQYYANQHAGDADQSTDDYWEQYYANQQYSANQHGDDTDDEQKSDDYWENFDWAQYYANQENQIGNDDIDANFDDHTNSFNYYYYHNQPVVTPTEDDNAAPDLSTDIYALTYEDVQNIHNVDDYVAAQTNDDFMPLVPIQVGSGKIFQFARAAALKLNLIYSNGTGTNTGDIIVTNRAYKAMIDTLLQEGAYAKDFNTLCSGKQGSDGGIFPEGCAMFAVQFTGGDDRIISTFGFSPGQTTAFYNTLYNPKTMFLLAKSPPTRLIHPYYECIQSVHQAIYIAATLAHSGTQVAVTICTLLYMTVMFTCLTSCCGFQIKSLKIKEKEAARAEKIRNKKLESVLDSYHILKTQHEMLLEKFELLEKEVLNGDRHLPRLENHLSERRKRVNAVPAVTVSAVEPLESRLNNDNSVRPFVVCDDL